jgi:hypothetical protein
MSILSFYELPEEDRPPEEFYGDDEAMSQWFESVRARRRNGSGGSDDVEVPMTRNEIIPRR